MKPQPSDKPSTAHMQATAEKRKEAKQMAVNDVLSRFHTLPDEAHVRLPVVMALFACSAATVWRYVKKHHLPAPVHLGTRVTAWNVGQLRTALKSIN
jgi:predicted DNA-binding transcriptional regulator AlpA